MIIFINGSINAGKSTIAKLVAKEIGRTAILEIDSLHEMIGWMPIDQAVSINLENAIPIIKNFVHHKLNVIVPYPLSENNYNYLKEELNSINSKIYFFTLSPKIENALVNRGNRDITKEEKERIKHHYKIGIPLPSFGEIIDNSNQTPEETAKVICRKLK